MARADSHKDAFAMELLIGLIVLALIVVASMWNKEELKAYQALKNKRRFGGKRLSAADQAEYERLSKKYWWY